MRLAENGPGKGDNNLTETLFSGPPRKADIEGKVNSKVDIKQ
jgi:hypothetical protein